MKKCAGDTLGITFLFFALLLGSAIAVRTTTHTGHRDHNKDHRLVGQPEFLQAQGSAEATAKADGDSDDDDQEEEDKMYEELKQKSLLLHSEKKDGKGEEEKEDDESESKSDKKDDDSESKSDKKDDDGESKSEKKDDDAESESEGKESESEEKKEEKEESKSEKASKTEVALEKAMKERTAIQHEIESMEDTVAFESELHQDVKQISDETSAPSLAHFLGKMWKEMRMFASPFYLEHLGDKLKDADAKIEVLEKKVEAEDKAEESGEDAEALPKKDEDEKEKKEKPKRKMTEAKSGPTPQFTEETMPAVSPTLQCVISLSLQYFLIYTALAIVRTLNQFSGGSAFGVQKIIESACTTVTFAPMLSVLFLGARMRAIQLTQGETEKYQLPQPWVQSAMYISTYAVTVQVLLVLLAPIATGEKDIKCDDQGNLDMSSVHAGGTVVMVISTIRYVAMAMLYGSMIAVCVGIFRMEPPKEIWGTEGGPPVSPAVSCVMNLTFQFFGVYLALAIVRTVVQLSGPSPFLTKLEGLLTLAKYTVNFAPMLCILFVGARMRALQIDPKHGNPQVWAQRCFYLCTYSVMVQTILVILMPFVTKCECKQGASEGDVTFKMENPTLGIVMTVIRYVCLVALYAGFTAVMVSVFLIEHPTDVKLTPPISPAMQCVMNLTVQYFTVYLALFICITIKQFSPGLTVMDFLIGVFEAGQKTVMFAPMLSMLFIGARMRALQLTKASDGTIPPTAGPQPWAQDGMFLATWSVLIQLIMTMVVPLATGTGKPQMDEDGNVITPEGTNKYVGIFFDVIKYICLLSMYGGAMTVVYAVYTMTPETLPPYCKPSTLIPGVSVPKPPTPPTPSF